MKKAFTLLNVFSLFLCTAAYSQTASTKGNNAGGTTGKDDKNLRVKWTTNPFDDHVFIQNNGQFDGKTQNGEKVLYGARLGKIDVLFTGNGIVYRYDNDYFKKKGDVHADPDDPKNEVHETHFLNAQWQGASKMVSVEAKDQLQEYYMYSTEANKNIKAYAFREIKYKNLYPGIDAIFQFRKGEAGLKYALIVHPGADISKIKINYSGAKNISKNGAGDIIINSGIDLLTEHAPVTNYQGESGNIPFSNVLTGTTESFKAGEAYDGSKTIVIDPWITDPLFPSVDKAYDMTWDYHGNVYVYGGNSSPWQLVKLNSSGVIQWRYNASLINGDFGAFTTDRVTGTSYLCQGFSGGEVLKVNTLGVYLATFPGDPSVLDELWGARFDPCNRDIVIAGGGTSGNNQAGVLDTNMSTINPVNILGASGPFHDMALIAIDPDGNHAYIASAKSAFVDPLHFDNDIMQLPLPSLSPTVYSVHENCHFVEVGSVHYVATETNEMNGACASPNWLYLYNSDTIRRFHKNTGLMTNTRAISPNTPFEYGGIDVDACDDLFVGVQDSLYAMDSTYLIHSKILLPGTCYDVQLGQHGALYACGDGFVTQVVDPITPSLISSAAGTPSSCSACNGTATVNVNCGISPYSFHWSNGNTNETDTGLCAGVYTVTVTDASCPPNIDSVVVTVSGEAGFSATVIDTNPDCAARKGSAYAKVTGGNPPYTYSWSNGCTTQKDTGLMAGTYSCTITDNIGCKTFVSVVLTNPTSPHVLVAPALDSICAGSNISLLASGAKTYSWTPSAGLTCNNCANPTASPSVTTVYTITGTDSLGCTDVVTATIKIKPGPRPIISGPDSACVGENVTLNVTGGVTYEWFPSGSTNTSISFIASVTQTVTVLAANGSCSHDTTFVVTVVPDPTAGIATSKDSVCSGDSLTLEGGTGLRYKWKPGNQTTAVIHVNQATTTTYTLYTYSSSCIDSVTRTIPVINPITGSISSNVDSICPGGSAILTARGIGGQATYKWSPGGETTASITVMPPSTMTYTALVCGLCDTIPEHITITVVPVPLPVITGTNWKCRGVRDTLTVSNANGPATYVWSSGKTTSSYTTGFIEADSTVTVTAYNKLGCRSDTTFTITLRLPLTIGITPPATFCAGQQVCISANIISGTPTNPLSFAWTPDGQTTDTICVSPTDTTSYGVTVSNGCKASKSTELMPNYPNLNACCNQTLTLLNDTLTPGVAILVASGNSRSYSWTPAVSCLNPPLCDSVQVSPMSTTTYTVSGVDSNGCSTSVPVTINVEIPCFNLVIPNVFTPSNGGLLGLDKVFYIKTNNIDGWSITIFDRWGKTMYNSTDQYKYWDGSTESGGQAPAGVYYYIITGTCQNTTYKKDGYLQLIR